MKTLVKGQSLVEVVVSIGIIVLVITGVVMLMVNTLGARNKGFDRKKATELAQKVVETILADKQSDPIGFWQASYWTNKFTGSKTDTEFPEYNYNVLPTTTVAGCVADCVEVKVVVGWNGSADTVTVDRLFTKY